jgi:hypothetical protein
VQNGMLKEVISGVHYLTRPYYCPSLSQLSTGTTQKWQWQSLQLTALIIYYYFAFSFPPFKQIIMIQFSSTINSRCSI